MNSSRWSSARWTLDEQEPVNEQSQVEAGGGRRWMNNSPWRLEEVDGGDDQYPVESRFALRHTPPDEQDARFVRSAPTQVCFVRFAVCHTTPDQQDPRFDRRRSVSSVLRYATPLPINMTPVSTIGGPFPPYCGTPDPSRSTGPRSKHRRFVSSVVQYARPHFHRLYRPSRLAPTHSVASQ